MYNVMLVDDEEEARLAIERKINWQGLGFNVVATAENGQDALEKALDTQPDVVMTDINMPFMNGLEFSKQLKAELPATKVVIFSGYDEFDYAKEAIELSAEEYILKPIDKDELEQVFSRIKIRLDEELDKRRNLEILEKYYQESFPFFREQFLIGLIEGHIDEEKVREIVADYGEGIQGSFYAVGIINLSFEKSEQLNTEKKRLLSVSLNQLTEERLDSHKKYICLNYLGDVIVIGSFDKEEEYKEFELELDQICKLSAKLLQVQTNAGIGSIVTSLKELNTSFKAARDAVTYCSLYFENQAVSSKDMESRASSNDLIEKAKDYILEHYNDSELSVDRMCNILNVSPNYFSTLFKKNTGLSFVNYLTNTRMEKAVWLLEHTNEKAYIIAGMVGYEEPNYFSYVFKKAYGISPSKYRQQRGTE
jgi:two-component system response regulator YesN